VDQTDLVAIACEPLGEGQPGDPGGFHGNQHATARLFAESGGYRSGRSRAHGRTAPALKSMAVICSHFATAKLP
jgi:hypothetical protein